MALKEASSRAIRNPLRSTPMSIDNTVTTMELDIESMNALTRAEAIQQGHICMSQAKSAFADSEAYKLVSRLEAYNNHLTRANFHAARAHAFYALAALLPE
jgi:hypothetical protein